MKLVYSKIRSIRPEAVHRFDVLGDFVPSDLDVLRKSLSVFIDQLNRSGINPAILILDISESTICINESKLQKFIDELKTLALASQVFISIAQTDIESMLAEQNAVDQALLHHLNLLENRMELIQSVKEKISSIQIENIDLQIQIDDFKQKPRNQNIFEKLWGET